MSTFTPNYNLEKPDASDPISAFRALFNSNMDKIDDISGGGGGGGGGHVIVDENGNNMPSRLKLEFKGNVEVTDDAINNKTVVDVKGGGGGSSENYSTTEQVVGKWIDGKPLYQVTFSYTTTGSSAWTAIPFDTTGWNIDYFTVKNFSIILNQFNYHYGMSGLQYFCVKDLTTGQIKENCTDSNLRGRQIYLTVQYTKTTD